MESGGSASDLASVSKHVAQVHGHDGAFAGAEATQWQTESQHSPISYEYPPFDAVWQDRVQQLVLG